MPYPLHRFLWLSVLCALTRAVSGCATRHFVKHEVAAIDVQIARIDDVQMTQAEDIDRAYRAGRTAINLADQAAMAALVVKEIAGAASRKAADAERRADTAQGNAPLALNRIDTAQVPG